MMAKYTTKIIRDYEKVNVERPFKVYRSPPADQVYAAITLLSHLQNALFAQPLRYAQNVILGW